MAEYEPKWELICENTFRMKTPEGWIVRDTIDRISGNRDVSVAIHGWIVLDPEHAWVFKR